MIESFIVIVLRFKQSNENYQVYNEKICSGSGRWYCETPFISFSTKELLVSLYVALFYFFIKFEEYLTLRNQKLKVCPKHTLCYTAFKFTYTIMYNVFMSVVFENPKGIFNNAIFTAVIFSKFSIPIFFLLLVYFLPRFSYNSFNLILLDMLYFFPNEPI